MAQKRLIFRAELSVTTIVCDFICTEITCGVQSTHKSVCDTAHDKQIELWGVIC